MDHRVQVRNRGVLTGILGGLVGRSVSLLAPFVVMPAMLQYLGASVFGFWMTAVSLTSMALFVDFGIGNGLLTKLSRAIGSADHAGVRGYIASAYVVLTVIALALLSILALAVIGTQTVLPVLLGHVVPSGSLSVFVVCLVTFFIGVPASVIQRVMYASQKAWVSNIWQILAAVLSVILCLVSIQAGLSPWKVIAAYALPPVLIMVVSTIHFFGMYPQWRPRIDDFSKEYAADLLSIGSRFLILSVITSIALNVDNLIIVQRLGAAAVTEYAVPAKLASLLGLVVTALFLPLWAANGEALARQDYAWVKRTTLRMSLFGGLAVLVAGGVLLVLSDAIIHFWMGREFDGQFPVLMLLSVLSVFMAFTSPFNMVLNSLGSVKPQLVAWMLFLVVSVLLKYFTLEEGKLWLIPMISALTYLLTVAVIIPAYVWWKVIGADARPPNAATDSDQGAI